MNKIIEIIKEDLLNRYCVTFQPHRYKDNEIRLNIRRIGHTHSEGLCYISSILTIENEILKKRQDETLSGGFFQ
jgi:hypothetical protein